MQEIPFSLFLLSFYTFQTSGIITLVRCLMIYVEHSSSFRHIISNDFPLLCVVWVRKMTPKLVKRHLKSKTWFMATLASSRCSGNLWAAAGIGHGCSGFLSATMLGRKSNLRCSGLKARCSAGLKKRVALQRLECPLQPRFILTHKFELRCSELVSAAA